MNTIDNRLLTVYSFQTLFYGYGHWKIKMQIDNPEAHSDSELDDPEGNIYQPDEVVNITYVTTNSRAIDGYDGGDQALAYECLHENEYDGDDFDLSNLDSGDEE